jgi:hypothetical protein
MAKDMARKVGDESVPLWIIAIAVIICLAITLNTGERNYFLPGAEVVTTCDKQPLQQYPGHQVQEHFADSIEPGEHFWVAQQKAWRQREDLLSEIYVKVENADGEYLGFLPARCLDVVD